MFPLAFTQVGDVAGLGAMTGGQHSSECGNELEATIASTEFQEKLKLHAHSREIKKEKVWLCS